MIKAAVAALRFRSTKGTEKHGVSPRAAAGADVLGQNTVSQGAELDPVPPAHKSCRKRLAAALQPLAATQQDPAGKQMMLHITWSPKSMGDKTPRTHPATCSGNAKCLPPDMQ